MSKEITKIPQPGDVGPNVSTMQKALNDAGIMPQLKVDGDFGPKTRASVSAFQKSKGLPGSGVPGEKTIAFLGLIVVRSSGTISSGVDIDEGTPPWYRRMFVGCQTDPGFESQVANTVNTVKRGYDKYLNVAIKLGFKEEKATVFAWILGAIHFKEASCSFLGVLHNGERIIGTGKLTTIVPIGRGPFETWDDAAVDAINLNGARWAKLRGGSTDIGEILYAMERFNGTGYLTGAGKSETSPYLWACSNVNDGYGKYPRDHVWDPNASVQSSAGAALILKELYKQGLFKCSGVVAAPPIPLPDTNPHPGTLSRQIIADKIVSIIQRDVDAELRETNGYNRSPRIDSFNSRVGVPMGTAYCAAGGWCAIDDACKALGLKNPVRRTAASQDFRRTSFVPAKYLRPSGELGKKGDVGTLQVYGDANHGHHTTLKEDQTEQPYFKTVEYNTDAISGDRDGDGAYEMKRSTIDRSSSNSGKLFISFADIPQWIFEHNNGK